MFLHLLSDTQQKSFLALAKQFVETDRELSLSEHNLLELMYAESGLPFETDLPEGDRAALLAPFDSRQAKAAVVLELIGVGHADQEFSAEESAFINDVAKALGISCDEVKAMEVWVEKQLGLAQEAESFWAEPAKA